MKYYKSIDYYMDIVDKDIYRYMKAAEATYVKEFYDYDSRTWEYIGIEFKLPDKYPWLRKITEQEAFIEII